MSNNNSSALPTSSKLSRGIKGSIQRIFVGEKNNNQVVVYKYNIITKFWYKEYTISSPDSSILKFGFSLAGTDDASIVAIGAPGTTEGRVYIYEKDSTGSGWSQRGTTITHPMLNSSGTGSDGFGHSVSLSQHDGNILVVGAPFFNEQTPAFATSTDYSVCEGRVFIFKYVGGTGGWAGSAYSYLGTISSPSGTLSTSLPASWKNFYFGYSLDISDVGNMIIVGSPSIRKLDDIAKNNQETGDLFFDTSVYDEYYNAVEVSELETAWEHTGNAHVYHNHTVLSGGTTWTSNVNVTGVIGVTSIGGITVDTQPEKIRPFEAVGTSVGINRAGTRIFATAPYSYGTSNASPQIFSGRIYTLEWNYVTSTWDEMGTINKHINGGINFRLLGFSAEFDGSGNRIVAGAPEWVSIKRKLRGHVEIFDWNGDAWVSYPTSSVSVDLNTNSHSSFYFYENMRLGDSVSVDGEGEMIGIGMGENNINYGGNVSRPSQFSIHGITYIGGATTTVAGSDSHILTGTSNIWVYNVPQSMIVSGNMTVSGCMQTAGIAVGSNDDTDTSRKTIFFGGTKADNAYDFTVIENRVYESAEKSELLIFKGDNNADFNGGGIYGPDRIRLKSGQICFDLNTGYERDGEDIRFTMNKNKLQGGQFGVNTASPTEAVDVYGKIKSSQGFIGRGEELLGLDLHDSLIRVNDSTGIAGSSYNNDLILGEMSMISSSTTYPTVNLTSNVDQGYTVLSSFDVTNAWKVFDSSYTGFNTWQLDTGSADGSQGTINYTRFGPEIGYYLGSTERFPGYPGEWIEIQMASSVPKLLLTEVLINVPGSGSYPVNLHVFGSNNGTDYYHIHTEIKPWSYVASTFIDVSAFTRTPSINETAYNKFVLICSRARVPFDGIYWSNVRLKGNTLSAFSQKLKLNKAGMVLESGAVSYFTVTVNGSTKFVIDGTQQPTITLYRGVTYRFDQSDSSNGSHPFRISTTAEGSQYSSGSSSSYNGSNGSSGAYRQFIVPTNAPDTMYYNCSVHSGMGGTINILSESVNTGGLVASNAFIQNHIGIGTSSPAYPLDVNGNMNISGGLRANGSSGTSGQVLTSSGGGAMSWSTVSGGGSSVWSESSGNAYRSSGNIGINTNNPQYKLDVNGTVNATSFRGDGANLTNVTAGSITAEASSTISISTIQVQGGRWDVR